MFMLTTVANVKVIQKKRLCPCCIPQSGRSLEARQASRNSLHLNVNALSLHFFDKRRSPLPLTFSKSLITILILFLEVEVGRGSWSPKNYKPILEDVSLVERPVSVFLKKFVGIEVFSGGLATTHQEKMVDHQRCGIWQRQDCINKHGKGDAEVVDSIAEGGTLLTPANEYLRYACCK